MQLTYKHVGNVYWVIQMGESPCNQVYLPVLSNIFYLETRQIDHIKDNLYNTIEDELNL